MMTADGRAWGGAVAAASYVLGLGWTAAWMIGLLRACRGALARELAWPLFGLQAFFLLTPILQTLRFPYYSSMKAMFVLPASGAAAVLVALGAEALLRRGPGRAAVPVWVLLTALACTAQLALAVQTIDLAIEAVPVFALPRTGE